MMLLGGSANQTRANGTRKKAHKGAQLSNSLEVVVFIWADDYESLANLSNTLPKALMVSTSVFMAGNLDAALRSPFAQRQTGRRSHQRRAVMRSAVVRRTALPLRMQSIRHALQRFTSCCDSGLR